MNYYPHHIGDFDKATRHLTRLERSIYRDLLDMYYDTEQPIPLDMTFVCRKILACSNEEATVVERTLNEFFTKTEHGWKQNRCDEEILKFRGHSTQRAAAGKASAAVRAQKKRELEEKRQQALNARSTGVELPLNGTSTNQNQNQNHIKDALPDGTAPDSEQDAEKAFFDLGVKILTQGGHSERSARGLLGRLRKTMGDQSASILMASRKTTDPAAYISRAMQPKPRELSL